MKLTHTIEERFLRYVQIDTTAEPGSATFPSSLKQKDLGKLLVEELLKLGLSDAKMDEFGYVFATLPSNIERKVPTICFCSHMDTAPDCSGTNVKPIVHRNYQGQDIVLPDDNSQVLRMSNHPYLQKKIGDDIITASGHTLLGADDKAGVAIIMDFVAQLAGRSDIPHGDIRILFTPDEEIGRGVDFLDMKKLKADFGYTLDGGPLGSIENESFSADSVTVEVEGISSHPGYAKDKMVNASKVISDFIAALPKNEWSPETTEKREGFVHPVSVSGELEKARAQFIVRDHDTKKMYQHEERLKSIWEETLKNYPELKSSFTVKEQYRNMREVLDTVPFVTDYAIQAMETIGLPVKLDLIRGGTDGSRLSFMGLPCPNIFTGEMAIHSRLEYVSIQDMEKAVLTLIELVKIWSKHN
jgi:tripeptide aminopeptidase